MVQHKIILIYKNGTTQDYKKDKRALFGQLSESVSESVCRVRVDV